MFTRFLAATLVGFLLTSLGHYYLYLRLVQPLSAHTDPLVVTVFVGLWALSFFGFPIARAVPVALRRFVELLMFVWMGTAYVFLLLCLLTSPVSLALRALEMPEEQLAWGVLSGGALLTIWALFAALRSETVRECSIPIRAELPLALEGLRVVVVSDIHVSGLIGRRRMRRLARAVNALKPDLIFATGDLVDGTVRQLRHEIAPLSELHATHGVFYVTGNHEYYCNPQKWRQHFAEEFGWTVLSNENCSLDFQGARINLVGLEDRSWLSQNRASLGGADIRMELATRALDLSSTPNALNLLLAHQPKDTRLLPHVPWIDLQISGHTHGGQVWPLYLFVHSDQKYNKGLYQVEGGPKGQMIYVNQGTGFWGPPIRLGTHCEISLLTFKRTSA